MHFEFPHSEISAEQLKSSISVDLYCLLYAKNTWIVRQAQNKESILRSKVIGQVRAFFISLFGNLCGALHSISFSGCVHRKYLFGLLYKRIAEEKGNQSDLCEEKDVRAFWISLFGSLAEHCEYRHGIQACCNYTCLVCCVDRQCITKDNKSLRIVHSLEPLNAVTIVHSGLPPATDELVAKFAERACGGMFDLYVRYDERLLAKESRDVTTFQTPYGALHLVTLPMGWTHTFWDFLLESLCGAITIKFVLSLYLLGLLCEKTVFSERITSLRIFGFLIRNFAWSISFNII